MIDMEYNYYFPHCILVTKWFYNIIFRCVFLNSISYYSIVHFKCLYSRIFKIYVSSTICMIENENIHLDIDMIIKNIKLKSILIYSL